MTDPWAEARDPETPPARLVELSLQYPDEVNANPALSAISLEDPARWQVISENVRVSRAQRRWRALLTLGERPLTASVLDRFLSDAERRWRAHPERTSTVMRWVIQTSADPRECGFRNVFELARYKLSKPSGGSTWWKEATDYAVTHVLVRFAQVEAGLRGERAAAAHAEVLDRLADAFVTARLERDPRQAVRFARDPVPGHDAGGET